MRVEPFSRVGQSKGKAGAVPALVAVRVSAGLAGRYLDIGRGDDQHPIRVGVEEVARAELHPGKVEGHLSFTRAAFLAFA